MTRYLDHPAILATDRRRIQAAWRYRERREDIIRAGESERGAGAKLGQPWTALPRSEARVRKVAGAQRSARAALARLLQDRGPRNAAPYAARRGAGGTSMDERGRETAKERPARGVRKRTPASPTRPPSTTPSTCRRAACGSRGGSSRTGSRRSKTRRSSTAARCEDLQEIAREQSAGLLRPLPRLAGRLRRLPDSRLAVAGALHDEENREDRADRRGLRDFQSLLRSA